MSLVDHSRGIKKGDDDKWYRFEEKRFLFEESIFQSEIESSGEAGIFKTKDVAMECDANSSSDEAVSVPRSPPTPKLAEMTIDVKSTGTMTTTPTMDAVVMSVVPLENVRGKMRLVARKERQFRTVKSHEVTFYMTSINIEVVKTLTGTAIKVTGETTESAAKRSAPVELPIPFGVQPKSAAEVPASQPKSIFGVQPKSAGFGNFNLPVIGECAPRTQSTSGPQPSNCVSPPPNVSPFKPPTTGGDIPEGKNEPLKKNPAWVKKYIDDMLADLRRKHQTNGTDTLQSVSDKGALNETDAVSVSTSNEVVPIRRKLEMGDLDKYFAKEKQTKKAGVHKVCPVTPPNEATPNEAVRGIEPKQVGLPVQVDIETHNIKLEAKKIGLARFKALQAPDVSDDEEDEPGNQSDEHVDESDHNASPYCQKCHAIKRKEDLFKSKSGIFDICISCKRREQCSCKNGCSKCSKKLIPPFWS